jgi:signal peptidase I
MATTTTKRPAKKTPAQNRPAPKKAPAKKVPARKVPARKAAPAKEAAPAKAAAAAPAPTPAPRPRRTQPLRAAPRRWKAWVELPLLLLAAIVVTLIVKALLAQAFYIPSASMEPQLHINDRVVVSRTAYHLHDVHRGDIVVFPSPLVEPEHHNLVGRIVDDVMDALAIGDRGEDELIKRVVGLPGETVEARDGVVRIDGRVLREPYLPPDVRTDDFGPIEVPEGRVFVMGDNRGNSHDSRFSDIGTIEVDKIVGRAIARVWPPQRTAFL